MMRAVLAMGVVLVVAGCGSSGGDQTGSPTATVSVPSSTFTEDLTVTSSPSRGRVVTVRGTVADGVEAGCLTLTEAEGLWLLVGETAGLRAGDTVTVRGAVMDDLATTCQQGQPLWVDEVLER